MQILAKYKIWIFFILAGISLSFLILQSWVRAYLDASYQFIMANNFRLFTSSLFDISWYTYVFSGDRTQLISWRYIQIAIEMLFKALLGLKWGAIFLYLSYFAINYFFSERILAQVVDEKYAYIGALVYTFNPLSIYMLNEVWFLYVYSAVPMIIYGFMLYFYGLKHRGLGLFLCGLGTIFLTSYTRFMLIYILLFVIIALLHFTSLWKLWIEQTRRCIWFVLALFFINIPFVFSVIYPISSGENKYFGGVSNYADAFQSLGSYAYQKHKEEPVSKLLVPTEPTGNFWYPLRESEWFRYFTFLYFSSVVFFLLYKQFQMSPRHKILLSIGACAVVLGVGFRILSHYVSEDVFVYVSYTLLPFLANNSAFSHRLTLAGISMLVPLALYYASSVVRVVIWSGAIVYCLWTASVLFFFHDNQRLHTVNVSESNPTYTIFHGTGDKWWTNISVRGSLSYPSSYLIFDWSPYPLPISLIPGLAHSVETNERTTSARQTTFGRYISHMSGLNKNLSNLAVLNISSFLVMQNIRDNIGDIQFDFYNNSGDYVNQGILAAQLLMENTGVTLSRRNALYKIYDTKESDRFLFSVYLPASIIFSSWYDTILDTWFDLSTRPVLVDSGAYNRPTYIDSWYTLYTSWTNIYIKTSYKSQFSFYVKISNITPNQDILLQLNKTFGVWWDIKKSSKNIFDSVSCDEEIYYPISNNTFCYVDQLFPSLRNMWDVFTSIRYDNVDHFQGNIVGNTRVLKNPETIMSNGDIYILISNHKQYMFILMQSIALCSLMIVLLYGLYDFSNNRRKPWRRW